MSATLITCPECNGQELVRADSGELETCQVCGGTGEIPAEDDEPEIEHTPEDFEANTDGSRGYGKEFDGAYADDDL